MAANYDPATGAVSFRASGSQSSSSSSGSESGRLVPAGDAQEGDTLIRIAPPPGFQALPDMSLRWTLPPPPPQRYIRPDFLGPPTDETGAPPKYPHLPTYHEWCPPPTYEECERVDREPNTWSLFGDRQAIDYQPQVLPRGQTAPTPPPPPPVDDRNIFQRARDYCCFTEDVDLDLGNW